MGTYDVARNKTKTAIIEAFWKLYAEKDISKITVRDITEATGIHRATFTSTSIMCLLCWTQSKGSSLRS